MSICYVLLTNSFARISSDLHVQFLSLFNTLIMYNALLPGGPPSRMYLGLGVMLVPYVRHGMYISGDWHRDWQTTFSGAPIIFIMLIAP